MHLTGLTTTHKPAILTSNYQLIRLSVYLFVGLSVCLSIRDLYLNKLRVNPNCLNDFNSHLSRGWGVLEMTSYMDDRMGAKIKAPKNPWTKI